MAAANRSEWSENFLVYSAARWQVPRLDTSDKILLPAYALEDLEAADAAFPLQFLITNPVTGIAAACSVEEFTADSGTVVVPGWIMEYLGLQEEGVANVALVVLPKGISAVFQPESRNFDKIGDRKSALEDLLKHFSTLTKGATIHGGAYFGESLVVRVAELEPYDFVGLTDVDLAADFAPSEFATAREATEKAENVRAAAELKAAEKDEAEPAGGDSGRRVFVPFGGEGHIAATSETGNIIVCPSCGASVPAETYSLHTARCERLNRVSRRPAAHSRAAHPASAASNVPSQEFGVASLRLAGQKRDASPRTKLSPGRSEAQPRAVSPRKTSASPPSPAAQELSFSRRYSAARERDTSPRPPAVTPSVRASPIPQEQTRARVRNNRESRTPAAPNAPAIQPQPHVYRVWRCPWCRELFRERNTYARHTFDCPNK